MLTIEASLVNKCRARNIISVEHTAFLVSVLRSTPNHTLLKCRCLIKKSKARIP